MQDTEPYSLRTWTLPRPSQIEEFLGRIHVPIVREGEVIPLGLSFKRLPGDSIVLNFMKEDSRLSIDIDEEGRVDKVSVIHKQKEPHVV